MPNHEADIQPGAAVLLTHWGLIRAQGVDAASFLHSQLTASIQDLPPGEARLAGYCSAKGRLLASFLVWRTEPEAFLLACSASVLQATLKRLSMFVLRAKCTLSDASLELALVGEIGADATPNASGEDDTGSPPRPWIVTRRADDEEALCLPSVEGVGRVMRIVPRTRLNACGPLSLDVEVWRTLEIRSGIPLIEAANVDAFVPQMLNLELLGGVNFQKGCYPGQEVVARTQYRGILKRRMFLYATPVHAHAGQDVFDPAEPHEPAGRVVNAAYVSGSPNGYALVEIKLAALASAAPHLGGADGPALRRLELPYAVEVPGLADAQAS